MNSKPKIIVCDDYERVARTCADWTSVAAQTEVVIFEDAFASEAEKIAAFKDAEVVCLMRERTPLKADLLAKCERLKLVIFSGQRNNAIDIEACRARGIRVVNTNWGPNKASTAEQTWALILACSRRVVENEQAFRQGQWRTAAAMTATLEGQTLGIVGLGSIGSRVAAVGKAFGMKVIAWSENLTLEKAAAQGAVKVSKEALCQQSDVISLHMVYSPRSHHLINAEALQLMKEEVILVNTSRAGLIDESALFASAKQYPKRRYGIDVFDVEPTPVNHPWLSMPNTALAPHLGYVTQAVFGIFYQDFVRHCEAYLRGDEAHLAGFSL